jgi:hypothetical protein
VKFIPSILKAAIVVGLSITLIACGSSEGEEVVIESPAPAPVAPPPPVDPAPPPPEEPAPAPQPTPAPEPAPDTVPPVIVLNGGPTITLEFGSVFNDPGATATDDVSGTVDVTASNPNTQALGTQQIVYTAVDAAGNSSSLARQLIVQDTTPPEINLVGDTSVTIELGEGFVDDGAIANDNYDGLLEVSVDFSGVDFETLGAYNILYNASDTSGNTSVTLRELIIEPPKVFTIMLEWVAPEFRQDGAPLSLDEIFGYKVYMGNDESNMDVITLVDEPSANSLEVEDLNRGVYYISISAIDKNRLESPASDPVRMIL